jgi:hypothetical protein
MIRAFQAPAALDAAEARQCDAALFSVDTHDAVADAKAFGNIPL